MIVDHGQHADQAGGHHRGAALIGADGVIGVKVFIYEIGSAFVEVMAIGTAIVTVVAAVILVVDRS